MLTLSIGILDDVVVVVVDVRTLFLIRIALTFGLK